MRAKYNEVGCLGTSAWLLGVRFKAVREKALFLEVLIFERRIAFSDRCCLQRAGNENDSFIQEQGLRAFIHVDR